MVVGTLLSPNVVYLNFNHKTGTLVSSHHVLALLSAFNLQVYT